VFPLPPQKFEEEVADIQQKSEFPNSAMLSYLSLISVSSFIINVY